MILCIGDSLTFGNIGYSYIPFLGDGLKAVNKGLNGDTTVCALKRLKRYIPHYSSVDTWVVGIGINDILLPYTTTVSLPWKLLIAPRCVIKKCVTDDGAFGREYEKLLKLLSENDKKIILIGLPMTELERFPVDAVRNRNAIIAELADKYGALFIDTLSMQTSSLTSAPRAYTWRNRILTRFLDGVIMTLLPFTKDLFSASRRLTMTVDGVHFNSTSARLLAGAVNDALSHLS